METIDLRVALRQIPTSVCLVETLLENQESFGVTIGSFASVSLNPPLVSFNISKNTQANAVFMQANSLSITFLQETQADIAQHFAMQHNPKADLMQNAVQLLGNVLQRIEAGDSTLFLVEITHTNLQPTTDSPLLYCNRAFRTLA
jgi:flavin reductase (DIM6/NTAB) family NADH-FMN oxidoreductase RutF